MKAISNIVVTSRYIHSFLCEASYKLNVRKNLPSTWNLESWRSLFSCSVVCKFLFYLQRLFKRHVILIRALPVWEAGLWKCEVLKNDFQIFIYDLLRYTEWFIPTFFWSCGVKKTIEIAADDTLVVPRNWRSRQVFAGKKDGKKEMP